MTSVTDVVFFSHAPPRHPTLPGLLVRHQTYDTDLCSLYLLFIAILLLICAGYTEEVTYPCADYKPGDDDLQSFDFIRKFELDVNLDGYPGVARCK